LEGSGHDLIDVLSRYLEDLRKNMEDLRVISVQTEIRTKHLTNTSLECHLYTSLYGVHLWSYDSNCVAWILTVSYDSAQKTA
jgi:hypothetical protein